MKICTRQKNKTHVQGFSLIELLVSMSIFTIVMTMAVGTLIVIVDANTKAQYMQDVMTNITFALDSMTREIRTGRGYYCSSSDIGTNIGLTSVQNCSAGTNISIVEGGTSLTGNGYARIQYRYNTTRFGIDRRVGTGDWLPITSNEVIITDMFFSVEDAEVTDDAQANVTIYISGNSGQLEKLDTAFNIQTTVTKRLLDL